MAEITAAMVKKLRDLTGAGMMECKAALTEANGDIEEATTILRKRGLAQATKKAGRSTNEGLIGNYIHMGGKIGVLVEVNCESDFVARTEDFQNLAREIAMHIAAASPQYVRREDVPADILEREKAIYRSQMEGQNKPAAVIDKIVEGKLKASTSRSACSISRRSAIPKVTIGQVVQAGDRQDGREHLGRAVRALQARRNSVKRRSADQLSSSRLDRTRGQFRSTENRIWRIAAQRPARTSGRNGLAVDIILRICPSPPTSRVLLKLSGEALMGEQPFGIDPAVTTQIAKDIARNPAARRPDRRRHRRRQPVPRPRGERQGHGPRDGRLHGHARHRHQRAGAAGRARAPRRADARGDAPSRCAPSPSRSSAGAPSATSRRAASSSSPPAPAIPTSPPTPPRRCARWR